MSEEFKGNMPNVGITTDSGYFVYFCKDSGHLLTSSCAWRSPYRDKCFDCLGFNKRFGKYYWGSCRCACGRKVDFGYFIFIYLLEKAELLPDDFKMKCCICKK